MLKGPDIAEFRYLLSAAFDEDGLEMLVMTALGGDLYRDYSGRDLPRSQIAFEILKKTENDGRTDLLLAGAVRARRNRADLREFVARVCPKALEEGSETKGRVENVVSGVNAVRGRLHDPAIRSVVSESRADLVQITEQIDLLRRFKELHDCLHRIQLKHYRQVADVARRFRMDPLAADTLESYVVELRTFATDARTAASGLPGLPTVREQELTWVGTLDAVVASFRTALDRREESAAAEGVRKLRSVIRQEPFRINRLLAVTARGLPLDRLIATLDRVAQATAPDDDATSAVATGLVALRGLQPALLGRVEEHAAWQDVENDLWQADDSLFQDGADALAEFRLLWSSIVRRVQTLCAADSTASWSTTLLQLAAECSQALPDPPAPLDLPHARRVFGRFRHDAMYRFYLVDLALKTACGEVTTIGQPLKNLLAEASDG